eukprot:4831784-Pyramimonas_sp.AAC.1
MFPECSNGPFSVARLAKALHAHPSLEALSLAWNGLGEEGGVAVGIMLAKNDKLRDVDLSHTGIGPRTALSLAEGLRSTSSTPSLTRALQLAGNALGLAGLRYLSTCVRFHRLDIHLGMEG